MKKTQTKEQVTTEPETVMVHTADGIFMKDVTTLRNVDLRDLYLEHLHFVRAAVRITSDKCMSDDCDGAEDLPPILMEVERRLEYLRSIGNDVFRRFWELTEGKTA